MPIPGLEPPREDQRDLFEQIMRLRAPTREPREVEAIVDLFYHAAESDEDEITIAGIMRVSGVSRPTARVYRDILLKALKVGPQEYLRTMPRSTRARLKKEEAETPEAQRTSEHAVRVQGKRTAKKKKKSARVTPEEAEEGFHKQLRHFLKDPDPPPQKINAMTKLIETLGIRVDLSVEAPVDRRKVLGPEGLAGMQRLYLERFARTISHRVELKTLWAGLCQLVVATMKEDVDRSRELPEGVTPAVLRMIAAEAEEKADEVSHETAADQPDPQDGPTGSTEGQAEVGAEGA